MVTSVPWQLQSADRVIGRAEPAAPGSARRAYWISARSVRGSAQGMMGGCLN